jgi:quinol-cytochrome oxidoreductase complex cytochrome b subunit
MKCNAYIYAGIALLVAALCAFASSITGLIVAFVFGLSLMFLDVLDRIDSREPEHFVIGLIVTVVASIAIATLLAAV